MITGLNIDNNKNHVVFRKLNNWLGTIEKLYVDKDKRRKGIATKFLRTIECFAIADGIGKLSLLCRSDNDAAVALYLKNGFFIEATLKRHYSSDTNHYVLSKFIGVEKIENK